jgi:hypothetical protein
MARANLQKNGLRYYGSVFAENVVPRLIPCQVATNYGTALYKGDPVKRLSDGSVAQAAAGSDLIFGVIAGVKYRNADGNLVEKDYVPASTTYTPDSLRTIVMVVPATPFTIFEVDADDGSSITTVANARALPWENCDHVFTTAGNNVTGMSGVQLDISTHATTALQWRILDISAYGAGNDVTQTLAKYLVICNKTQNWPGTFSTTGI